MQDIDIETILPDEKDRKRAVNLQYRRGSSFYGSGAPFGSEAAKMAKLITDPRKLVRRSMAVVAVWGTGTYIGYSGGVPKDENAWTPFRNRLRELDFGQDQIEAIVRIGREIAPNFGRR